MCEFFRRKTAHENEILWQENGAIGALKQDREGYARCAGYLKKFRITHFLLRLFQNLLLLDDAIFCIPIFCGENSLTIPRVTELLSGN